MTNTKAGRRIESLGSLEAVIIQMDVTSYATGGEDVSAAGLGIARDPVFLAVTVSEKRLGSEWDKTNKKIKLFYPLAQHAHALLVTGGQAAGAALQIEPDSAAAVLGKTAATNRTLAEGTPIQNKAAAQGGELAAADDGGTIEIFALY